MTFQRPVPVAVPEVLQMKYLLVRYSLTDEYDFFFLFFFCFFFFLTLKFWC